MCGLGIIRTADLVLFTASMKIYLSILILLAAASVSAQTNEAPRFTFPRWGPSVKGGSIYNFDSGMDGGGSFAVNRYFMEAGIARMWDFGRIISVSAGYGQDDYHFSGLETDPWNNIDNFRVGLFARWALDERWALFAGPSVRSYGESGTRLEDALTGSFFGGVSYKFGDRLTLGPGFIVSGQLDDDTRYFPVLLVNWNITEKLSFETGGGFAATAGPGLSLVYDFSKQWKVALSGRYESKRFRLNDDSFVENGVGEDRNVPVVGNIGYFLYPGGSVSAVFGYNFSGKIRVYDERGGELYARRYDSMPFAGLVASFRF